MPPLLFEVTVVGRRLWVEVDGRVRGMSFRVARVVDAINRDDAASKGLVIVASDPKAQGIAGKPVPELSVENVVKVKSRPAVKPGFMFFPEEG
jgi:hypothetical protein